MIFAIGTVNRYSINYKPSITYSISPRGEFEKDKIGFVSFNAIKLMNRTPCNDRFCTFKGKPQEPKEHRYRTATRDSCLVQWKDKIFIFGGEQTYFTNDIYTRIAERAGFHQQISMLTIDSSSQAGIWKIFRTSWVMSHNVKLQETSVKFFQPIEK